MIRIAAKANVAARIQCGGGPPESGSFPEIPANSPVASDNDSAQPVANADPAASGRGVCSIRIAGTTEAGDTATTIAKDANSTRIAHPASISALANLMSTHYIPGTRNAYDQSMASESDRTRDRARKRGRNSSGEATRIKLITVAEAMFADRGIAAVSLNEIRLSAGQSNAAVVNYHFGSKEELIRAILEDRLGRIDAERGQILDETLSEDRPVELRRLLEALVRPQVSSIERGERHVELVAQLLFGGYGELGGPAWILADASLTGHGQRLNQLLWQQLSHLPEAVSTTRLRFVYTSCLNALADHQRHQATAADAPATATFAADLIDSLTAIIRAPASAETRETLQT